MNKQFFIGRNGYLRIFVLKGFGKSYAADALEKVFKRRLFYVYENDEFLLNGNVDVYAV